MERTFFVTSVTARRRNLFQREIAAEVLREIVVHYRDRGKYRLHEMVIRPDRFHALITPAGETSVEEAVELIQRGFAFVMSSGDPVWRARFENHRIRDEKDLERHREYMRKRRGVEGDGRWSRVAGRESLVANHGRPLAD